MENTIEKTEITLAVTDEGNDTAYFDARIGKVTIDAEEVYIYRNGAIELINFLKAKFEI